MQKSFSIASSAYPARAATTFLLIFLAGCSALPTPPPRAAQYDFGPGSASTQPLGTPAARPPVALADIEAAGRADTSSAVLYRLAYGNAQELRPYQSARWSQPPTQLLQQALRTQLGARRAVLRADDAQGAARTGGITGSQPDILRIDLEEFSQVFSSATDSVGLLRLRATLVEPTAAGEQLLGQRVFTVQKPAISADAAGGTHALAEAANQVAQELAQWLEQLGR